MPLSRCPLLHHDGECLCPEDLAYEILWKEDADQRRKNCQLQNIQGQKSGRECIWYYDIQIQGPIDNHGGAPRNSERNLLTCAKILRSQYNGQNNPER